VLVQDIPVEEAINRASEELCPADSPLIRFLNHLEKEVPSDQDVHLIMNNDSTHKSGAVQRWLKPKKRHRYTSRPPAVLS
jgi:hypothetical protein